MDKDDPSRFEFFARLKRAQKERLERFGNDAEERKRFILRCASGGGMQSKMRRERIKVNLPKMSWDK